MRRVLELTAAVLLVLSTSSCKRDHLYYASSETATVLVEPDWTLSGVHPNGVTIYAYNEADGSLYKRFPTVSAREKSYIRLPEGDFTLVVMNDSPEEFSGRIDFVGEENIAGFQARGVKDEQRSEKLHEQLATRAEDEIYCITEPDTLAVAVYRNLHISPEQIDYYYDRPQGGIPTELAMEVGVEPVPVISQVNISAHVKGLKYARGTTLSYLRGVAAGHYMGLEENSPEETAQAFVLNNRSFDPGSDSDGTIRASFLSFGLLGQGAKERYILDINFVLINGKSYPLSFDVTELISVDVSLSLQLSLKLELEIELPDVVGDEGGGFNTDVIEWDDETVDIPM